MRKLVILVALLSLISCEEETVFRIDPALKLHVDKFYQEGADRGIVLQRCNLIVRIHPLKDLGLYEYDGNQRTVSIDEWCFYNYSHDALEFLVFHELGHALLGRDHCKQYSIMNQSVSVREYVGDSTKRKILVDELFFKKSIDARER